MSSQGFWSTVYAFLGSMIQAGSWQLYAIIGFLLACLFAWFVGVWRKLKASANLR